MATPLYLFGGDGRPAANAGSQKSTITSNYEPMTTQLSGSVPGTASSGSTGGGYVAPSSPSVSDQIGSAYDTRIGGLRDLQKSLNPQKKNEISNINQQYGTSRDLLQDARSRGNQNLDNSELQVENNRSRSLRDLSESLRNSIQAFQNSVGVVGAGDSSASEVLGPYAFTKLGAQGRTDINLGTQDNLAQIGLARQDVESEYNNQLLQAQTQADTVKREIDNKYTNLFNEVKQMITSATSEKELAMAEQAASRVGQSYLSDISQVNTNPITSQFGGSSLNNQVDTSFGNASYQAPNITFAKPQALSSILPNGNATSGLNFISGRDDETPGLARL